MLCRLPEDFGYHASCLLNLSTGDIGEMNVYSAHPTPVREVVYQTGFIQFGSCAGARQFTEPDRQLSTITLPGDAPPMEPRRFCRSCRERIRQIAASGDGYVICDMYDLGDIIMYSVIAGTEYTIRPYTVAITQQPGEPVEIAVSAHLFDG